MREPDAGRSPHRAVRGGGRAERARRACGAIPRAEFSRASRRTRSRISLPAGRRPGWLGYGHLRWIRRRCQAGSVPGDQAMSATRRAADGSARPRWPGRPIRPRPVTCRRRTATSWRSTMISASFDACPRPSRSRQPKTRVMMRTEVGSARTTILPYHGQRAKPQVTASRRVLERYKALRLFWS